MQPQHSLQGRSRLRRLLRIAGAMVVAAALVSAGSIAVAGSALTSEQVAAEIMRVQNKADQVAQSWAQAQIRSEELEAELAAAEDKLAATTAQYSEIGTVLSQIAINRFTGSSATTMLVVLGDPVEQQQMEALLSIALDQGSTDLDQVDALLSDLDKDRERVAALRAENEQVAEQLTSRQAEIEQNLSELATLREQLEDEEVRRAYEAQVAKKRRDVEAREAAAAAAAAQAQTAPTPASFRGGGTASSAAPSATPSTQPAPAPTAASPSAPTTPEPAQPAPAPTPDPPRPAPVIASGSGWFCPVAGPSAFGDTWGAPRSGGRKHQGVDMMSPAGTPLVAVVAGTATMKTSSLGGNVVSLRGFDGNGYYYGHLSAWEGGSRVVSAGEVIGYVGATGNTTANHLHFEIHPGFGPAINPYPTVRQYC